MIRVANPPVKPLLIFDGNCNFCRRWIARWQRRTGDRIDYLPAQELGERFPEIPRSDFTQSVQLIEPDGNVYSGAEAVFRSLDRQGLYRLPGVAPVSEWAYRLVAGNRRVFSALTPAPQSYVLTREIFIRLLGVIYLIAFVSLWTQVDGLIGSRGIMPVEQWMAGHGKPSFAHNGIAAYWMSPTVFWFNWSDTALHLVCGAGTLLSVCVVAGIGAGPALLGLWALYLSLMHVGNVFLGYQWDALLVEVGFLAIWFAPWGLLPRSFRTSEPPRRVLWLLRWLVFRLMFSSGIVKLASGDELWHSLTALLVHYQTQPLPPWTAWYAQQLPVWWQKFSCGVMFAIELVLPFLIFGPRRLRLVAAGGFALLMVLISLTGNYCFFNLLTLALCVTLLDDRFWCRGASAKRLSAEDSALHRSAATPTYWRNWFFLPVAVAILLLTIPNLFRTCNIRVRWPRWVITAHYNVQSTIWPFHSVNGYGLFAVMTTNRPEIIVEGSNDGETWQAYEFNYKPGDLTRRPRFVWPHQPRLDWQMWFAALGNYQGNPWFINFCAKLLQNEPAVTRLLAKNPFPNQPPRYIRAVVYEYKFTDPATRRATGQWW
ncbi:MAG: lipase maturation factor family protein, partial [Verrucomicrobiota bacterium]